MNSPNWSSPRAPKKRTGAPRRAAATATFAPLPPGASRKRSPSTDSPGPGSARRVADHVGADRSADGEEAAHAALSRTSASNRSSPPGHGAHQLGVPLHRHEPRPLDRLRRLGQPVGGARGRAQAGRERAHHLVVEAVDGELAAARRARELRCPPRRARGAGRRRSARPRRGRRRARSGRRRARRSRAAGRGRRRAPAGRRSRAAASSASSCSSRPRCTQAPSAAAARP